MPEPPEIRVTSGSPSPEDEEAIRRAILRLWREDQAKAAASADADPWMLAARAEATGHGLAMVREQARRNAWRLSGRFTPAAESRIQIGRGDSK